MPPIIWAFVFFRDRDLKTSGFYNAYSIVVIWYVYAIPGDSHKLGKNKRQQLPGAFLGWSRSSPVPRILFLFIAAPSRARACYNRRQLSGNAIWEMLHCSGFECECIRNRRWFCQNGGIIMPTKGAKPIEAYPNQEHNKQPRDRTRARTRTAARTRTRAGPRTGTGKIQRENTTTTQLG